MKILYIATSSLLFASGHLTAGILFQEGFETDGEAVRYTTTDSFSDGDADYFFRTDGSGAWNLPDYSGFSGTWFMAAEDIDSSDNPSGTAFLDVTGIDISATSTFSVSLDVAAGYSGKYDAVDDFLEITYRLDDGAWGSVLAFQNDGSTYNSDLFFDDDFDGIGSGSALDRTFSTFTSQTLATAGASFLDLRVNAAFNAGGEAVAYDNLTVTAVPEPRLTLLITAMAAALLPARRFLSPKRGHQQSRS